MIERHHSYEVLKKLGIPTVNVLITDLVNRWPEVDQFNIDLGPEISGSLSVIRDQAYEDLSGCGISPYTARRHRMIMDGEHPGD